MLKRALPALIILIGLVSFAGARPLHGVAANNGAPAGKAQVGLWFPFGGLDNPLINIWHMESNLWYVPFGSAGQDMNGLINAAGYPTALPTNGNRVRIPVSAYLTTDTCSPSGNTSCWVFQYDGTATCSMSIAAGGFSALYTLVEHVINSNRKEYSITSSTQPTGSTVGLQVDCTSITSGLGNFRIYRGSHEALLNAGKIGNPDFINVVKHYGRNRFMDWLATNGSAQQDWTSRVTTSQASWVGTNIDTPYYAGVATQSGNDYTTPGTITGNPTVWTDGMFVELKTPGAWTFKTVSGFCTTTNCNAACTPNCNNPPFVTATAHGYSTGNKVVFTSNSFQGGGNTIAANVDGNSYNITVIDGDHFTLSSCDAGCAGTPNSSTWGTFGSSAAVALTPHVQTSTLPAKRVIQNTLQNFSASGQPGAFTTAKFTYDPGMDALIYQAIQAQGDVNSQSIGVNFQSGFPIEAIIQIANEANINPWLNFPVQANDNFVTQFATTVCSTLNANLKPVFEFSNEVWNTGAGFPQTPYSINRAYRNGWVAAGSSNYNLWEGYRFGQVMTLATAACGSRPIERSMGLFTATYTTSQVQDRFDGTSTTGLGYKPCSVMDSGALGVYFESKRADTSNAQTVWQSIYGDAGQQTAAMAAAEAYLRDDGWVGTAHFSGSQMIVDSTVSGILATGQVVYAAGLPSAPSSGLVSISSGGPTTWNLSSSVGTIATETVNTASGSYTVKYLKDVVFPSWKSILSGAGKVSGCPNAKLTQYEGGWGYQASPVNGTFINPLTASSYNGHTFYNQTSPVAISGATNNGSGFVRLTTGSTASVISGQQYLISGVEGTTEANGVHTVTVVDGTHLDLDVSFSNTYVIGGVVNIDVVAFYQKFYQSSNFAGIMTDNLNNFVNPSIGGGEYPANYVLTSSWNTQSSSGYGLNQGSGLIYPNIYGAFLGVTNNPVPAFGALNTFNANWLLKRDLDPTANDNSPMFLNKAA